MAKKTKLPSKIVLYGGVGGIAIAAVLVAVFVFGVGVTNIAPQLTQQQVVEPLEPTNVNFAVLEDPEPTEEELQEIVGNTPIDEIDFGMDNSTITSNSTITEQVCDELGIGCGTTSLTLTSEVAKTDSSGVKTIQTDSFDIGMLGFFVEDASSRDFKSGFLEFRLKIQSPIPEDMIDGTGTFDILIANQTIFTEQIPISVSATSGQNGTDIQFVSSSGTKSDSIVFSFADHLSKFPTQGLTTIEVIINDLVLSIGDTDFGASGLQVFSMDIATDPDLIIIIDEEGISSRVYPTDDHFTYINNGAKFVDQGQCRSYWIRPGGTITLYDTKNTAVTTDDVLLKSGSLNAPACSYFIAIDTMLQRDQTYRLVHVSATGTYYTPDTHFDIVFTTPKSQKNLSFSCYWNNVVDPFSGKYVHCSYPSPDTSKIIYAPPKS